MQPLTSEEAHNSSEPLEQAQCSVPVPSESLQEIPVTCTRSERTVRLPKRFQDHIKVSGHIKMFLTVFVFYRVFFENLSSLLLLIFEERRDVTILRDIMLQYC